MAVCLEDDNLACLSHLDEDALLGSIRLRYLSGRIYTFVGDILLAVNPFRLLPQLYSRETSYLYKRSQRKLPPHVFALAQRAYNAMLTSGRNQVCVISGESGAGKTESSKFFIQQVMEMSRTVSTSGGMSLEDKILLVNPLLEAFGNAQTVLNDNSSRFGKFVELFFDSKLGYVIGAGIQHYLLEKSRIAKQQEDEKNFHIFYYMYAGLPPTELDRLHLNNPTRHRYINQNRWCRELCESEESVLMLGKLCNSLDAVEFTINERSQLFQLLAAVLQIGDVDIVGDDSAVIATGCDSVNYAAELLSVDAEKLVKSLTTSVNKMRGEVITIAYTPEKAVDCRDATAKALYGRSFNWIVEKINILLGGSDSHQVQKTMSIGVLDIFGFEEFRFNSLEQFCINLANEQLQYFFNHHIFAMEKEMYLKEGVDGSDVQFEDNMPILCLFLDKPIGLLSLLDEQSSFPRGTDQSAMQKFQQHLSGSRYYQPSKGLDAGFIIKHYAGSVEYQGKGFLDKNRDTLPANIVSTLADSHCPLIAYLFCNNPLPLSSVSLAQSSQLASSRRVSFRLPGAFSRFSRQSSRRAHASYHRNLSRRSRRGNKGKTNTVCGHFRKSLDQLMTKLNSAQPHFIRCIKPNDEKMPATFNGKLVVKQLRYTGMVEAVRVRKEGYSYRPKFAEFLYSYKCLGYAFTSKIKPTAGACAHILTFCGLSDWKIGHSCVLLKFWQEEKLNSFILELDKHACVLQKITRGFLTRRRLSLLQQHRSHEAKMVEMFLRTIELQGNAVFLVQRSLIDEDTSQWRATSIKPVAVSPPPIPERTIARDAAVPPSIPSRTGQGFWHTRNKRANAEALARNFKAAVVERQKSLTNWRKEEGSRGAGLTEVNSTVAFSPWFHGMLKRSKAEAMLQDRPSGTFLIRTSESRFGYSISVYWEPRTRHHLVEQIPGGKYRVVGISASFDELAQLVDYYSHHTLSSEGEKLLISYGEAAVVSKKEAKKRGVADIRNYRGRSGWGRNRGAKSKRKMHRLGGNPSRKTDN